MGIAIDAIRLAPKLDAVVIVSGDGDFVPLVEHLKFSAGCQVEVASFAKSSSAKLLESCDDFIDLSKNKKRYLINKKVYRNKSSNTTTKKTETTSKNSKKDSPKKQTTTKIKKTLKKKKTTQKKHSVEISRVDKKDIIVDGTEK